MKGLYKKLSCHYQYHSYHGAKLEKQYGQRAKLKAARQRQRLKGY
ncbi:hypothetical protein NVP1081O_316 [Vibrio phage 1.081.O._10N.286.52.C2]|nr:hypothetical protein NVP1081O_316 [Vibrio phage 1.081.O._10N.286.52.C2]